MSNQQAWWQLDFFILTKLGPFIGCYDLSESTNTVSNKRVILNIQDAETCEMQAVLQFPV
jgi:hypothetical protein